MHARFPHLHPRRTLAALFLAVAILGISLPWALTSATADGSAVVVTDTFSRTLASSWGSADLGGAYSLFQSPSDYAVSGGQGLMTLPAAQRTLRALLPSVSLRDVDLKVRVATNRLPTPNAGGAGQFAYVVARHQADGKEYRGYVRFDPRGRLFLLATYSNNGEDAGEIGLGRGFEVPVPGLTHAANQFFQVRMQVTGVNPTTVQLKTWQDGTPEPGDWQLTVNDSYPLLQHAGSVGLQSYVSLPAANGPVTFRFDDLQVTNLAP